MRIGITVIGPDREGVVAAFTGFVFEKRGNIERITQNVVKGLFGMHLEATFPRIGKAFESDLQLLADEYGMEVNIYRDDGPKNIAIFVTKEPHCLETILKNRDGLDGKISIVVGTQEKLRSTAERAGIPFLPVLGRTQEDAEAELVEICKKYQIGLIVLARYMRILTPNFVWRYPNRIINIHPSLLPAFPGAVAYEQAYERGTKMVGVTSHYVTENLDQGPIILQKAFEVKPSDSLESIKKRGQRLEASVLFKAVQLHLQGRLRVRWRRVHLDDV